MKEIKVEDIWNDEKIALAEKFIKEQNKKRTTDDFISTELMSIKIRMEDFIEKKEQKTRVEIADFIEDYLSILKITKKKLAEIFEIQPSHLHKYLNGERKLNKDILLKLSSFTHIDPESWLRVEIKNELIEVNKTLKQSSEYKKYDYRLYFDPKNNKAV